MLKINSNPIQNITCLSLENTNWEKLSLQAISSGLCNYQMEILKDQFDQTQFKIQNGEMLFIDTVFIIEDCIFLGISKMATENIAPYIELHLDLLNKLKCPTALGKILVKSINKNKHKNFNDDIFEDLENDFNNINPNIPLKHLNDFIILEIPKTTITAFDIINEFNLKIDFCNAPENIDLNKLYLQNLYYKNRTVVAFDFVTKNSSELYKAWSLDFINAILKIAPLNINTLNKSDTLNILLDKINTQGVDKLSPVQKEFLSSY